MASPTPHDSFIKKALENPRVAREFFEVHLPPQIKEIVDFEHLSMEKESFVDGALKKNITDILFTTNFQGKPGYLWLLLEHQSSNNHFMSFRLLKYMINIWQRHLEQHPKTKVLPLIYPMIFYNGRAKYTSPLSFYELFADPILAKFCLEQFQLINVHEIPDEEIKQHVWSGIFEYFMKHVFERDFLKVLENEQW